VKKHLIKKLVKEKEQQKSNKKRPNEGKIWNKILSQTKKNIQLKESGPKD